MCGGANNQLATDEDAARLRDAGVLYCPDYVVNAGGVVQVADELQPGGPDPARVARAAEAIPATLTAILEVARTDGCTTEQAAARVAEDRIEAVSGVRRWWIA